MFVTMISGSILRCTVHLWFDCDGRMQMMQLGSAPMQFPIKATFIALPQFVERRRTRNPLYVLGFSVGVVVTMLLLFVGLGAYLYRMDRERVASDMERREQEVKVIAAAKDAHEKTIAYATHQLR